VLLGVAFLSGATRAACDGFMDVEYPKRRRSFVRLTAGDGPGPFFGFLLTFYAFGIGAIVFGVYRLAH
jgi:hypothetical protein